jgi:hypothetical protein
MWRGTSPKATTGIVVGEDMVVVSSAVIRLGCNTFASYFA